jgi:hypothetical protein
MAWSVDRLDRSLQHPLSFLAELHALRVDLYLHQQRVDTTTPSGRALFGRMSVFAEFERALIQERVRAGLARAKARASGLADHASTSGPSSASAPRWPRAIGILRIAADPGVASGTVQRVKAALAHTA